MIDKSHVVLVDDQHDRRKSDLKAQYPDEWELASRGAMQATPEKLLDPDRD
jgi:hypothetical protein